MQERVLHVRLPMAFVTDPSHIARFRMLSACSGVPDWLEAVFTQRMKPSMIMAARQHGSHTHSEAFSQRPKHGLMKPYDARWQRATEA